MLLLEVYNTPPDTLAWLLNIRQSSTVMSLSEDSSTPALVAALLFNILACIITLLREQYSDPAVVAPEFQWKLLLLIEILHSIKEIAPP